MNIGLTQIDFDALLIEGPAGRFSVEPKVMAVFAILAENPNTVISRETLIDKVWGVEHGGDERLSRAISILRKALGDIRGQHSHIETIPRNGYRLIAELGHEPAQQYTPSSLVNEDDRPTKKIPPAKLPPTPVAPRVEQSGSHEKHNRFRLGSFAVIGIIAIAVFVAGVNFMENPPQKISQISRIETGLEDVKNFTLDNAIVQAQTLFSGILADNPEHAAAQAGLALALIREYTYLERDPALLHRAKSAAEMSLKLAPQLALASIAYGWAVEYEGDYDAALKALDRADILDPDNIFVLEARVRIYQKQKKYPEAHKILEKAISLYPDFALFHSFLGYQWAKEEKFPLAEASFRHAIKLSKDNPRLYVQLASVLGTQGRNNEAIQAIQDGLKVRETGSLYNNLGHLLLAQGQYAMGAQAFERALKKGNSHNYLVWANLGTAYSFIPSRKAESITAYNRAVQLLQIKMDKKHLNNSILYNRMAFYNAKRDRFDLAREAMARVPFDGPVSAKELNRASIIYEILGERDQALTMLERAINAGYPLDYIYDEEEYIKLRQDPKYHRLLARLNINKDSE